MVRLRFPPGRPDPKDLQKFGPRLEIEVGRPIVHSRGKLPLALSSDPGRFIKIPALIDTGAGRTVLTPQAIQMAGLPLVDYTTLSRAGGEDMVAAHVAAIQFPRYKLATIEMIQVLWGVIKSASHKLKRGGWWDWLGGFPQGLVLDI